MNQTIGTSMRAIKVKVTKEDNSVKTGQSKEAVDRSSNESKSLKVIKMCLEKRELEAENEFLKKMCEHKELEVKNKLA